MKALKVAGGLWIIGGLNSAGMAFGTLGEPVIFALSVGGAVVGLSVGALLLRRPGPDVVRWSNLAGGAWLIAFGALTLAEIALQMGYELSVALHTAIGVIASLVAYWGRAAAVAGEVTT